MRTLLSTALVIIGFSSAEPVLAQQLDTVGAFDPKQAFCERQTFALERMEEVSSWLDYVGGLRVARTEAPELNECPSSTVRAIYNIITAFGSEGVEGIRSGFLQFYVGRAVQPELVERVTDQDGSFRYLNDVTLASLAWLTCPGTGDAQLKCVRGIVEGFPEQFLETSPVFCDFARTFKADAVERPPERTGTMLLCAGATGAETPRPDAWLLELDRSLPR